MSIIKELPHKDVLSRAESKERHTNNVESCLAQTKFSELVTAIVTVTIPHLGSGSSPETIPGYELNITEAS